MIPTFLLPLAFALLPLPFLARRLLRPLPLSPVGALRVPFYRRLAGASAGAREVSGAHRGRWVVALAIWCLLVLAAARPALVGDPLPLPVEARDLMLAIDLSGSMEQEDLTLDGRPSNRLAVVKATADDFIERREGDRVGLVLFGERAYLQAPLTFDREVVRTLLDEAQVGLIGQRTAIGDAIAIALKRLRERPVESRVLVLLTDGASNAGVLEPLAAARLAEELGIRIYTIGVGADRMTVRTPFGTRVVNPSEELDEATLERIAEMTGGRYFRARDVAALAEIYTLLDQLEPVSGEPLYTRPTTELFFWPLGAAYLLALLWATAWVVAPIAPRRLLSAAVSRRASAGEESSRAVAARQASPPSASARRPAPPAPNLVES